MKIKIALVDDQHLFRQGLRSLLEEIDDIEIIFESSNGKDLLEKLKTNEPDVVLLDIEMPIMDGIKAAEQIHKKYPEIKMIVLTMHDDNEMITHLIKKGASAFLPKNADIDAVVEAIRAVQSTGYYFNEQVSKAMLTGLVDPKKNTPKFKTGKFDDLELAIIRLICKEFTNEEIGEKLDYSPRTIDFYRASILKKIGAKNTAGMVMYAVKNNLT